MKKNVTAAAISLILIISTSSLALEEKPTKCPSVNALRSAHFNIAQLQGNDAWTVVDSENKFDTAHSWTFFIFDIEAGDEQQAFTIANNKVKNLTFSNGPVYYREKKRWACIYLTAEGEYAASYTPTVNLFKILGNGMRNTS